MNQNLCCQLNAPKSQEQADFGKCWECMEPICLYCRFKNWFIFRIEGNPIKQQGWFHDKCCPPEKDIIEKCK